MILKASEYRKGFQEESQYSIRLQRHSVAGARVEKQREGNPSEIAKTKVQVREFVRFIKAKKC